MNFTEIRRLVKLVESSQISELEIEEENTRVKILKVAERPQAVPMTEMVVPAAQAPAPAFVPSVQAPLPTQEAPPAELKANETIVESPMVGTFYRAPSPEAPPYVQVGDRVKPGQVLCIIEAMKLMNEIESEVAGVITEISVENAQPVEFGLKLFKVEQD